MALWFGGKWVPSWTKQSTNLYRISKTMGESFKLHAQALIGYVDEINADGLGAMPTMPPMQDHQMMAIEATY
jgi:hypothetical protein